MTRIILHIGVPHCGPEVFQEALDSCRDALLQKGVLFSRVAGQKNHTKLYMAVTDPNRPGALRMERGYAPPRAQEQLRGTLAQDLLAEVRQDSGVEIVMYSASQLASLPRRSELERLKALLSPISEDITILAHVEDQGRVLLRHYAGALLEGRIHDLAQEIETAAAGNWGKRALESWEKAPSAVFPEVQAVPHWLDYASLVARWEEVFGKKKVVLRSYDPARFSAGSIAEEICEVLDLGGSCAAQLIPPTAVSPAGGKKGLRKKATTNEPTEAERLASLPTLTRWRQINVLLDQLSATGRIIPKSVRKNCLSAAAIPGQSATAGALWTVSKAFQRDNMALCKAHLALKESCFKPDNKAKAWTEAEPEFGFRSTQYVAAYLPRIDKAVAVAEPPTQTAAARIAQAGVVVPISSDIGLSSVKVQENLRNLRRGRFAPHNRIGKLDETTVNPGFVATALRTCLPGGSTGKVIVGCMKNEAPYILEWVAYHRQVGIDNFLIYTNNCSDGTDAILDRLDELGIVQHRLNDDWRGKSPQQYALNRAMREPVVANSDWLIHIDVDEFINVRIGNGTIDDFLAQVPEATNVAMTWRMFGHNGVTHFEDRLVIEQFDKAAPKYCPKPHTNWGFKTMTRNVGVYSRLSCHRPIKPDPDAASHIQWVNGSGERMKPAYHEKGWRSDLTTIGYDLLQLNHYALRSAESFLIKRERGRALHVDRSIGLNYWARMDWSTNPDVTIKRNIPRVVEERARLLHDPKLRELHEAGVAWHTAKAAELRSLPEFEELYQQALRTNLTDLERVALALTLDMET